MWPFGLGGFSRIRHERKVTQAYEANAPRAVDWLHRGGENGLREVGL